MLDFLAFLCYTYNVFYKGWLNNMKKNNVQEKDINIVGVKFIQLLKDFWNSDKNEGTQKEDILLSKDGVSQKEKDLLISTLESVEKLEKETTTGPTEISQKIKKLNKNGITKVKPTSINRTSKKIVKDDVEKEL